MRQSGRTLAMLKSARQAQREGQRVLVVVHSARMIDYCLRLCREHDVWLVPSDFTTAERAIQRMRGMRAEDVFVDHFVWEQADVVPSIGIFAREYDRLTRMQSARDVYDRGVIYLEPPDPWCDCRSCSPERRDLDDEVAVGGTGGDPDAALRDGDGLTVVLDPVGPVEVDE